MKKVLMILGGVFLILVVVVAAGIGVIAIKGRGLDRESKQYVDSAIPAIVAQWNEGEISRRASPEFKAAVGDDDLKKLLTMFRRLGKLSRYNGSEGQANMSVTTAHGKVISAAYVAKADFETGPAEIKLSLIKHGDQWQILGIHVNSRVFLQPQ